MADHTKSRWAALAPPATVDVLIGWIYLIVGADSCVQAQTFAGMLLAKTQA